MQSSVLKSVIALGIVAIGMYGGVTLIRYSDADDAPGGMVLGALVVIGAIALGVFTARRRS